MVEAMDHDGASHDAKADVSALVFETPEQATERRIWRQRKTIFEVTG